MPWAGRPLRPVISGEGWGRPGCLRVLVDLGRKGRALLEGIGLAAGTLSCYSHYYEGCGCTPGARSYENPKPGVWELVVESRRTTPVFSAPFTLEASVTR